MNVDTDTQYAFTREIAGHMFTNYDGVLKVDGEVGNKKAYDPRSLPEAGRAGHGPPRRRGLRSAAVGRDVRLRVEPDRCTVRAVNRASESTPERCKARDGSGSADQRRLELGGGELALSSVRCVVLRSAT